MFPEITGNFPPRSTHMLMFLGISYSWYPFSNFRLSWSQKSLACNQTISPLFQCFCLKAKLRDLSFFVVIIVPDLTISYSSQGGFDLLEDCNIKNVFYGFIIFFTKVQLSFQWQPAWEGSGSEWGEQKLVHAKFSLLDYQLKEWPKDE